MKQLSTRNLTLIALVAVTVLAISVFAVQKDKEIPVPMPIPENSENQEENGEGMTETIDTSDWQTYRNEELGFEVKYPEGYITEEYSDTDTGLVFAVKADSNFQNTNFAVTYLKSIDDFFVRKEYFSQQTFKNLSEFLKENYRDTTLFLIKDDFLGDIPVTIIGTYGHLSHHEVVIETENGLFFLGLHSSPANAQSGINNPDFDLKKHMSPTDYAILQSFTLLDPQESL